MQVVEALNVVNTALSVPRKASRGAQADLFRKVIMERDGHKIRIYSIPCSIRSAVAEVGIPELRERVIWNEGVECDSA